MRIISGSARGAKLFAPPGDRVRPTTDQVRESLFTLLGERVEDTWMLDAYAGVGTVGLEALSRGARGVDFVEPDKGIISYLKRNLERTNLAGRGRIFPMRIERFLAGWNTKDEPYDIVYADPAYAVPPDESAVLLRPVVGKLLVIEAAVGILLQPFEGYRLLDQRSYGRTVLYFLEPDT